MLQITPIHHFIFLYMWTNESNLKQSLLGIAGAFCYEQCSKRWCQMNSNLKKLHIYNLRMYKLVHLLFLMCHLQFLQPAKMSNCDDFKRCKRCSKIKISLQLGWLY